LVKQAWGIEPDLAFIESARQPLLLQMKLIEQALSKTAFLAGDTISIADSFLLPHLLFFGKTAEGSALLAKAPGATAWLARMCQRPSYLRSPMLKLFDAMRPMATSTKLAWAVA
jgi:glutathione S-transferase